MTNIVRDIMIEVQNQPSTTKIFNMIILYICAMTVTFDLEGQGHILFPTVDYVGIHIKINTL